MRVHHHTTETWQQAGMGRGSMEQQAWGRESKLRVRWSLNVSMPTASDVLPPAKPHLRSLHTQHHQLETKGSKTWASRRVILTQITLKVTNYSCSQTSRVSDLQNWSPLKLLHTKLCGSWSWQCFLSLAHALLMEGVNTSLHNFTRSKWPEAWTWVLLDTAYDALFSYGF